MPDRRNNRDDRAKRPRGDRTGPPGERRKPWSPEGRLPKWIAEEVARVTPREQVAPTIGLLQSSARAFASAKYSRAFEEAERAKKLSPRDPTIRELMALAAYRMSRWEIALRELRTFRRLTGDTTHMPLEMDVLRALDRPKDVEEAWRLFRRHGGDRDTEREARVVYGSFLLDQGNDRKAWEVTNPKRIGEHPRESELRVWFVAARAAARLGDGKTARRLYEAIQGADPAFPGLDDLDQATSGV